MTTNTDKPELIDIAVRVDIPKKDSLACVEQINKYLSCVNYIWAFEISKDVKKEHVHGNVQIGTGKKSLDTILDTFRKWLSRSKWCKGKKGSFSVSKTNTKERYLRYIGKDADIVTTTFTEEQLEHIEEEVQKFKDSRNRSMIDKLFNHVVGYYIADYEEGLKTPLNDIDILQQIIDFYRVNKLLMPNKSQMFQYVQTILNIQHCQEVHKNFVNIQRII